MPREDSLVLFDIDGTLLRGAGPHHRDALQDGIFAQMNVRATTAGIDTAGTLDCDLIALMLRGSQVSPEISRSAMERIVRACEAAYLGNCAADLRAFVCPGVVDLLACLTDERVTIGVVTGNLQAIGWKKLELAGLRNYFHVGAFSQDGATRAILARTAAGRALAFRNRESFRNVTLIGDHRNDIRAARQNGFRSIAVATGVLSETELWEEKPDLVVTDMTGLSLDNIFQEKNFSISASSSGDKRKSSAPTVPST